MARYRVTLFGPDEPTLMGLVHKHKLALDVLPHTLRQLDDDRRSIDVMADDDQISSLLEDGAVEPEALRARGYTLISALRDPDGEDGEDGEGASEAPASEAPAS